MQILIVRASVKYFNLLNYHDDKYELAYIIQENDLFKEVNFEKG